MNTSAPDPGPARCPHCGAEVYWLEATQCWRCGRWLGGAGPAVDPPRLAGPARRAIGLGSVMLVVALVAVILGVGREVPGLAIVLAILAAPALIRTCLVAARQRARGRPLTALDKVGIFAGTLAAVVVIGVSAIGAFVVTCMPIAMVGFDRGRNTYGLGLIAFLVGFSAALSAGYGAYRLMRRIGRRKD